MFAADTHEATGMRVERETEVVASNVEDDRQLQAAATAALRRSASSESSSRPASESVGIRTPASLSTTRPMLVFRRSRGLIVEASQTRRNAPTSPIARAIARRK